MNIWVHLRAEEWKQTHSIATSEVVLLSIGHPYDLVFNNFSTDHHCGGEPQGLTQNAICRAERTGKWMMSEGCHHLLNQQAPLGSIQRGTNIYDKKI